MYFAEFYNHYDDAESACGDRAVLIIDGRESLFKWAMRCNSWARKHNYEAFRLMKGDSFTRSEEVYAKQRVPFLTECTMEV